MQNKILTGVILLFITIGSGWIVDSVQGVGTQLTEIDNKIDLKFLGYDRDIEIFTQIDKSHSEEISSLIDSTYVFSKQIVLLKNGIVIP
jgi:hypothetical protein